MRQSRSSGVQYARSWVAPSESHYKFCCSAKLSLAAGSREAEVAHNGVAADKRSCRSHRPGSDCPSNTCTARKRCYSGAAGSCRPGPLRPHPPLRKAVLVSILLMPSSFPSFREIAGPGWVSPVPAASRPRSWRRRCRHVRRRHIRVWIGIDGCVVEIPGAAHDLPSAETTSVSSMPPAAAAPDDDVVRTEMVADEHSMPTPRPCVYVAERSAADEAVSSCDTGVHMRFPGAHVETTDLLSRSLAD